MAGHSSRAGERQYFGRLWPTLWVCSRDDRFVAEVDLPWFQHLRSLHTPASTRPSSAAAIQRNTRWRQVDRGHLRALD
jgi:hypothetical protein